jgi:hypothetical protein
VVEEPGGGRRDRSEQATCVFDDHLLVEHAVLVAAVQHEAADCEGEKAEQRPDMAEEAA